MYRALVSVAVLSIALALGAVGVAGQEASPTPSSVYLTEKVVNVGGVSGTSIVAKVFDATLDAPAAGASKKAYANLASGPTAYATSWAWKSTMAFTLSGDATITTWVSCDVAAVYRADPSAANAGSFGVALQKNGADLAGTTKTVYDTSPVACTGPTSIRPLSVTVPTAEAAFKAGDSFGVRITVWAGPNAPEAQHKNLHFLVGSPTHASRVTAAGLPSLTPPPEGPAVVEAVLEDASARVAHAFENATSDTYVFNWTTLDSSFSVNASVNATNGTVRVLATDGAANETLNLTLPDATGASNHSAVLWNATAGNWTIRLEYAAFQGSFDLEIAPYVAPAPTNGTADHNETDDGHAHDHKDGGGVPGLGAVGFAAAAVAAIALRRRVRLG